MATTVQMAPVTSQAPPQDFRRFPPENPGPRTGYDSRGPGGWAPLDPRECFYCQKHRLLMEICMMKAYYEQQRQPRFNNEGEPPQNHIRQGTSNASPHYQAQGGQNAPHAQPQGPGNWNVGQQQPQAGNIVVSRSESAPQQGGVTIWGGSAFTQSQHQNTQLDQRSSE